MKFRLFLSLLIIIILGACSAAQTSPPATSAASSNSLPPTYTSTPLPPTYTPAPTQTHTPTATLGQQIVILTYETPDLVLTSANLQLEEQMVELTAAANEIATLQSQSILLQTQLAQSATQAASSNNGGGNNNSSPAPNPDIPSNILTVVTTQKALVFFSKRDNDAGYPIMEIYEPRVKFAPGTILWVYPSRVRADGGDYFYQSYDPDGQSTLDVYFRVQDIQIKHPGASPNPFAYPLNVAMAQFTEKSVAYYAKGVDQGGKPIMEIIEPRIKYQAGDTEILYPAYVVATGGAHYYPIYDPDGKPSTYVRAVDVKFLYDWD